MAVPNPIVLLSIAECQVRSEQYAAGGDHVPRYLDERKEAPDRAQVEAQIAKLEGKPALPHGREHAAEARSSSSTGKTRPSSRRPSSS